MSKNTLTNVDSSSCYLYQRKKSTFDSPSTASSDSESSVLTKESTSSCYRSNMKYYDEESPFSPDSYTNAAISSATVTFLLSVPLIVMIWSWVLILRMVCASFSGEF
mmetsp:Transcript_7023/g.15161  ORF Transcript_7023/g.15161 Transcript_7023/m.15161 type:complete len:107 (+) Transcript_7023:79-399(+)